GKRGVFRYGYGHDQRIIVQRVHRSDPRHAIDVARRSVAAATLRRHPMPRRCGRQPGPDFVLEMGVAGDQRAVAAEDADRSAAWADRLVEVLEILDLDQRDQDAEEFAAGPAYPARQERGPRA